MERTVKSEDQGERGAESTADIADCKEPLKAESGREREREREHEREGPQRSEAEHDHEAASQPRNRHHKEAPPSRPMRKSNEAEQD